MFSYYEIQKYGSNLLKKVDDYVQREVTYTYKNEIITLEFYISGSPEKLLKHYLEHLFHFEWNLVLPPEIRIVFGIDGGMLFFKIR